MERRFRHHGLDRAQMVPAIEIQMPREESEEWKAMAGRYVTASHVKCMRRMLEEVPESEGGAIICEDDVLIHNEFAERLPAALANLPDDAGMLLLGFMVWGWPEGLIWSGRDPAQENLVPVIPWHSWGAHGYWISHRYAQEVVDRLGSVPIPELSNVVEEHITFPSNGLAAYPPLMLQEAIDSVVRPAHEMPAHVTMQAAWPYRDYAAAEGEGPPLSPLAALPDPSPAPLLNDLVETMFATSQGAAIEIEGAELGESVPLSEGELLSVEDNGEGQHRLVMRGAGSAIAEISPTFRFSDRPAERPTGIAIADDMLVLGFAVDDGHAGLAACKLEDALALLRPA
jgi:hypothetical protein